MKNLAIASIVSASMLAGCAAPPNTPGAGYGENYTPVVDMQGVDPTRYANDLAECRQYAGLIDANKQAITGAVVGALLGAALGSAYGLRGSYRNDLASSGGLMGVTSAGNKATAQQERILSNCMAGRGYRTLDGSAAQVVYVAPQQGSMAQSGSAPQQGAAVQTASIVWPKTPAPAVPTKAEGKWSYDVERLPATKACNPTPQVQLAAAGPGNETYTIACVSGDVLTVKCEFGNCRALR